MDNKIPVEVIYNPLPELFIESIQPQRKPFILRGIDIGDCTSKWNAKYISEHGRNVSVKVHVSEVGQMNFLKKNYLYKTLPFSELVKRASEKVHENFIICENEFYYLRSLGQDIRKEVANIHQQFPELAKDIKFPNFFQSERFFSSVFRIASENLQLWTHYDIMDNMLIQIQGKKKVTLFNPSDAENLYLQGDKSQVMDMEIPDLKKFPKFSLAVKHEAILNPGDILFIPALWFHNVVALEFGIAVNVFWKNLEDTLYDKKDPYGNKDLIPASRVFESLKKNLKLLENLPPEYQDFYGRRIVCMVKNKLYKNENLEAEN